VTGAAADIDRIRRRLGLFDPDPAIDADRAQHGAVAAYGNEPLGRWGAISALVRPQRIVRAVRSVLPPETGRPSRLSKRAAAARPVAAPARLYGSTFA
jgi:hypothetical protein